MRPNFAFCAAAACLAAAGIGALAAYLLIFPPQWLLERAARRAINPAVSWQSISRSGSTLILEGVAVTFRPATVQIRRASLNRSILQSLMMRVWPFSVEDVRISPNNPRWPDVNFDLGRGEWRSAERELRLMDCTSDAAQIDADIRWSMPNVGSEIEGIKVRGRARFAELGRALRAWKTLSAKPDGENSEWRHFDLAYHKGHLDIAVDSKPFFRAAWQLSDGAF